MPKNELSSQYKPNTVLNYGAARDLIYCTIYNQNDTVACVYTGHSLYLPQGIDPSTHLYMNGSADGIDSNLVFRSFCNTVTATTALSESKVLIYPNPVIDVITVTAAGKNNLRIIDLLGSLLIKEEFSDTIEIDFSTMNSGNYYIILNEKVFRILTV